MPYAMTTWQDRAVARPLTYTQVVNGDGSVTFTPAPGVITQAGTPQNALNLNNLEGGVGRAHWFSTMTNAGNAYSATMNPAPAAYVAGMTVRLQVNASSTGAVTINLNGLGAKNVKKANGVAVANWTINAIVTLVYNGTDFISQGDGGSGNAAASDLLSGKTASTDVGDIVGTMPLNVGDKIVAGAGSAGQVLGVVPNAYWIGTDRLVLQDANFIAANIPASLSMFGLAGTGANVKRFATGTGNLDGSGNITVTGLAFTPSFVVMYQANNTGGASPVMLLNVGSTAADIWVGGLGLKNNIYGWENATGTDYMGSHTFSATAGGFTFTNGTSLMGGTAVKWRAFE